jgi:hypothetical protein
LIRANAIGSPYHESPKVAARKPLALQEIAFGPQVQSTKGDTDSST